MQNTWEKLTGLVQHLVALIENEDADASKSERLVTDKSLETTWCTNNDVRAGVFVLQSLHVGLDRSAAVENASLDVGHVLAKSVVLITDLVGQFTSMTHDNNGDFAIDWLNLLESS